MNKTLELTIDYALSTKEELLAKLNSPEPVVVDLSKAADIDVSGIQILVSFMREAEQRKKAVRLTGTFSEAFRQSLAYSALAKNECVNGEQLEAILKAVY